MSPYEEPIRTMWRDEWVFEFSESELKAAAQAKVDFHKGRLEHWQGEHTTLRDKYIKSVQESAQRATKKEAEEAEQLAQQYTALLADDDLAGAAFRNAPSSASITRKKEIMGDPEIYQDLQVALGKVNEHRSHVEAYSRWVFLFSRGDGTEARRLTYRDAQFFNLA